MGTRQGAPNSWLNYLTKITGIAKAEYPTGPYTKHKLPRVLGMKLLDAKSAQKYQ